MRRGKPFRTQVSLRAIQYGLVVVCALFLSGCFGGPRRSASSAATGAYAHRLHNRFYEAWEPPTSVGVPHGKIVVPVDIEIDKSGQVTDFRMARESGYPGVDASIRAIARKVPEVESPPFALRHGHYHLRINFELDVER
jgi:TonB family protein